MDSGERGMFAFPIETPKYSDLFLQSIPSHKTFQLFKETTVSIFFVCENFCFLKNDLEKQFKIFL